MPSKLPVAFIVVATVCTLLVWVISIHFLFPVDLPAVPEDDYLPKVIAASIGGSVGLWVLVFVACLVFRDTIRRRGMWGYNFKRIVCPHCGTRLRRELRFFTWNQWMWGGWTCHECGIELSQYGRPWKQQTPLAKWVVLAAENANERERRLQHQEERIRNLKDQTQRGDAS